MGTCYPTTLVRENAFWMPEDQVDLTHSNFTAYSLIMVVFSPSCPVVLQVFSTIALTPNLTSMFQYDFNIGSFAQFGDPIEVARIDHRSERPDFRNISHLAIRQRLDAENFLYDFILIDEHTAQSHAIWWIIDTQISKLITEEYAQLLDNPPVTYPGEAFVLWQSHIQIQDFAYVYDSIQAGETSIDELVAGHRTHPYDPHDPQQPPLNYGQDYTTKEAAAGLAYPHWITATFSEIMYTTDPAITRYKWTKGCVALTPEAANLSGMLSPALLSGDAAISEWYPWEHGDDRPPRPGDVIELRIDYDWDSSRWPPPGVAAPFPGPTGNQSLASRTGRRSSYSTVGSPQQCVRGSLRRPGPALTAVAIARQ